MQTDKHVVGQVNNLLSILVSNHFGVLMRVTTIFSRRACNIKSLTVAETEDPAISRITILFDGDEAMGKQIEKLLDKQEDVVRAACLPIPALVSRELLLVKVKDCSALQDNMAALRERYNTRILSTEGGVAVVEFTGDMAQTENFITLMGQYGVVEICRTGAAALTAGEASIYELKGIKSGTGVPERINKENT